MKLMKNMQLILGVLLLVVGALYFYHKKISPNNTVKIQLGSGNVSTGLSSMQQSLANAQAQQAVSQNATLEYLLKNQK